MPVAINGSGTITGVSVGGLPDGIVDTDMIAADAVTDAKQSLSGAAKAWVNFNGTGTLAIRDSFNVSSITDDGTGLFTINFTSAMANANYVVTGATGTITGNNCFLFILTEQNKSKSTSLFQINVLGTGSYISSVDPEHCNVAVFGD